MIHGKSMCKLEKILKFNGSQNEKDILRFFSYYYKWLYTNKQKDLIKNILAILNSDAEESLISSPTTE